MPQSSVMSKTKVVRELTPGPKASYKTLTLTFLAKLTFNIYSLNISAITSSSRLTFPEPE